MNNSQKNMKILLNMWNSDRLHIFTNKIFFQSSTNRKHDEIGTKKPLEVEMLRLNIGN